MKLWHHEELISAMERARRDDAKARASGSLASDVVDRLRQAQWQGKHLDFVSIINHYHNEPFLADCLSQPIISGLTTSIFTHALKQPHQYKRVLSTLQYQLIRVPMSQATDTLCQQLFAAMGICAHDAQTYPPNHYPLARRLIRALLASPQALCWEDRVNDSLLATSKGNQPLVFELIANSSDESSKIAWIRLFLAQTTQETVIDHWHQLKYYLPLDAVAVAESVLASITVDGSPVLLQLIRNETNSDDRAKWIRLFLNVLCENGANKRWQALAQRWQQLQPHLPTTDSASLKSKLSQWLLAHQTALTTEPSDSGLPGTPPRDCHLGELRFYGNTAKRLHDCFEWLGINRRYNGLILAQEHQRACPWIIVNDDKWDPELPKAINTETIEPFDADYALANLQCRHFVEHELLEQFQDLLVTMALPPHLPLSLLKRLPSQGLPDKAHEQSTISLLTQLLQHHLQPLEEMSPSQLKQRLQAAQRDFEYIMTVIAPTRWERFAAWLMAMLQRLQQLWSSPQGKDKTQVKGKQGRPSSADCVAHFFHAPARRCQDKRTTQAEIRKFTQQAFASKGL